MSRDASKRTLPRTRLGRELQRLRIAAGLQVTEAGRIAGLSRHTIARIENGTVDTKPERVEWLCKKYGVPQDIINELTRMAVKRDDEGWWERHRTGVMTAFAMYAGAELEAVALESYEPEFLPGLLQTEAYFRALQATTPKAAEGAELEERIAARLERQASVLPRSDMRLEILIGAGAMAYLDKLPDVRDEQVARMLEVAALPHIDIRVTTNLHHAMGAAFTVVVLPDDIGSTFVYMDAMDGCRYVEDHEVVSDYRLAFRRAFESASPIERYLS